jgi:hypothetical protein
VVENVYSAVRTDCLYKADYVRYLESLISVLRGTEAKETQLQLHIPFLERIYTEISLEPSFNNSVISSDIPFLPASTFTASA